MPSEERKRPAKSPSEILDAILEEEYEACRAAEDDPEQRPPHGSLKDFWLHLDERFAHIVRSLYASLSTAKREAFVKEMEGRLDRAQLDSVLVAYLQTYKELLPGMVCSRVPKEGPMRWYVQGKGTAREPLIVLAPAMELYGRITATGDWVSLDPSTALAQAQRIPAPCIFDDLLQNHKDVRDAWEGGMYTSTSERWTIDSVQVPGEHALWT